jgi:hypothetical protein
MGKRTGLSKHQKGKALSLQGSDDEKMGFQFKIPLSAALAVVKGIQTVSTIILAAGDLTTILLIEAIANGVLMGLSYYKDR